MHEVDMTKCLLLALQQWRDQQESSQAMVDTIYLDVGRFTCVEPDQLQFTFQAAVTGTWLDGAQLQIRDVPFVGRCVICNSTYHPTPEGAYRSPCCDHPLEEIVSGRELRIRSIDYRKSLQSAVESHNLSAQRV